MGQFSVNSTLVYDSINKNYNLSDNLSTATPTFTKESGNIATYNVEYSLNAKKYLFDNAATREGTIITAPANGSNIIEVIMTIGEDNSITFSTS